MLTSTTAHFDYRSLRLPLSGFKSLIINQGVSVSPTPNIKTSGSMQDEYNVSTQALVASGWEVFGAKSFAFRTKQSKGHSTLVEWPLGDRGVFYIQVAIPVSR